MAGLEADAAETDAAAGAVTRRRHELDTADFELRTKFRRTAIVQAQLPAVASPSLAGGAVVTVRQWMRARGLENNEANRDAARAAVNANTDERWAGAEVTRIRKTQRLYDAEARRCAHDESAAGRRGASRGTAV